MQTYQRLILLLHPFRLKLFLIVVCNLLSVFFAILSLFLIEPCIQLLFQHSVENISVISSLILSLFYSSVGTQISLLQIVFLLILFFLLKNIFLVLSIVLISPIKSGLISTLRNSLYYKILILPLSFFTNERRGDVVSKSVNDTQELEFTVLKSIQQFLTEPLTVLIYLVSLFYISYQLTFFVLLLLPIAVLIISSISRSLRKKSILQKQYLSDIFSHVEETIAGIRMIKSFNAQEHSMSLFKHYNNRFSQLQKRIYRRVDLASPMSEFLGITIIMIILVFGGTQVLSGSVFLTPELFIVYISLISQIINPSKNLATAFSNYKRGIASLDRIYELLDSKEIIEERKDALSIHEFRDSIFYDNVSFSYTDRIVLNQISLKINKGDVYAIVGSSGSGKSTLVDLLPRFYDVSQGKIYIDGIDIQDYVISDLRSLFAIVSQEVILFNDTIYNNIVFGCQNVTSDMVYQAAKDARAFDFIQALPNGFATEIGDRGLKLSGGERQRISLARAILRNTPILIFDEATSALDTQSEQLVQQSVNEVKHKKTIIMIAHRLSTIYQADRIILLDKGQIVEEGTHNSLMDMHGKYYKMVNIENENYGKE